MGFGTTPTEPLTCPQVLACSEEDYSSWTYLGKVEVGDYDGKTVALLIDNEGHIYFQGPVPVPGEGYVDMFAIWDKNLTSLWQDNDARLGCRYAAPTSHYFEPQSSLKRYILLWDCEDHEINVLQKDLLANAPFGEGENPYLWTRDVDLDYGNIATATTGLLWASMSPNGKYIAVYVEKDTNDEWYIMMYEGS